MDISPDSILYAVLAFSWVEYLWEAYIGSRYKNQGPVYVYLELDYENAKYKICCHNRQRHIYRTRTTVPTELEGIMKKETFDKARIYSLDKAQFGAVQGIFSQVR